MSSNPSEFLQNIPWNTEPEAIWLGSSMTLRRNLSQHNFPSKLSPEEKHQVLHKLQESLKNLENSHFFQQKDLSGGAREFVYEHFLFLRGFEEPPDGSGILIENKGEFLALFNIGDHLQMRILSPTTHWDEAWKRLTSLSDQIEQSFAFSPKFGYLSSDPSNCGTGLSVYAYLHVPALIHCKQLESALPQNEEVVFMGLAGDLKQLIGDIVVVENNFSIGVSEDAILHAVQTAATKLIGAEKTMRSHLKEKPDEEMKDLISKAFGLLVHAYQLETKEALDLLSVMRLGLAIGEICNTTDQKLSELSFRCRRAHLMQRFPGLKESEEIERKRAAYIQEELKGIALSSETS